MNHSISSLSLEPLDTPETPLQRGCPRCQYVRQASDTAPEWQCPRCGVAYDKVQPGATAPPPSTRKASAGKAAQRSAQAQSPQPPGRASVSSTPERPWALIVFTVGMVLLLGLVGWKWQARHYQAAERAARAAADAQTQTVAQEKARQDEDAQLKAAEGLWRSHKSEQALPTVEAMAQQGHPRAMVLLGLMHWEGRGGMPKNPTLALQWLQKAAQQGSALAAVWLGYIYEKGPQDMRQPSLAENWYRKAARAGDSTGLYSLGKLYAQDLPGVGYRPVQALMLLELAMRDFNANPTQESLTPNNQSAFWAQGAMRSLEPRMSITDAAQARRLADAWKPGMPLE